MVEKYTSMRSIIHEISIEMMWNGLQTEVFITRSRRGSQMYPCLLLKARERREEAVSCNDRSVRMQKEQL